MLPNYKLRKVPHGYMDIWVLMGTYFLPQKLMYQKRLFRKEATSFFYHKHIYGRRKRRRRKMLPLHRVFSSSSSLDWAIITISVFVAFHRCTEDVSGGSFLRRRVRDAAEQSRPARDSPKFTKYEKNRRKFDKKAQNLFCCYFIHKNIWRLFAPPACRRPFFTPRSSSRVCFLLLLFFFPPLCMHVRRIPPPMRACNDRSPFFPGVAHKGIIGATAK